MRGEIQVILEQCWGWGHPCPQHMFGWNLPVTLQLALLVCDSSVSMVLHPWIQSTWELCETMLLLSCFSRVRLCDPIDGSPPSSPHPWDSPGKNTGVGCHFLLQWVKVKSESEVTQLCPTQQPQGLQPIRLLCPWIFQAGVLEWGAIAFSSVRL